MTKATRKVKKMLSVVTFKPCHYLKDDNTIVLCLPIPHRACSPNSRRGESRYAALMKGRHVKRHRTMAKLLMIAAMASFGKVPKVDGYSLSFYFRTVAFRDDDNADASCKPYRDGIADALGKDDRMLRKKELSTFGKDSRFPRVEITIKSCHQQISQPMNAGAMARGLAAQEPETTTEIDG